MTKSRLARKELNNFEAGPGVKNMSVCVCVWGGGGWLMQTSDKEDKKESC